MPPEKMRLRAVRLEHLRYQQAQLIVAQDGYAGALGNLHLIQDFARGRKGLDEDGVFGGDRRGHPMKVANRQREKFAKCSRMLNDSEDGSGRAVAAEAPPATLAMSDGQVNFAYDPFPNPSFVGGFCNFSDEFVARRAGKAVVSAPEFE